MTNNYDASKIKKSTQCYITVTFDAISENVITLLECH